METKVEEIQTLSNICCSMNLLMKKDRDQFCPLKLAYHPYEIQKKKYSDMEAAHKVWQKLTLAASKDSALLDRTFKEAITQDEMVRQFYNIYQKTKNKSQKHNVFVSRSDYFLDNSGELKLIEYNFASVSMLAHSQNFAKALELYSPGVQAPKNRPLDDLVEGITQLYKVGQLSGIFMMVVLPTETNFFDQMALELSLKAKGIKTKRVTFSNICCSLRNEDGKLFFCEEEVSVVYYRAGYQLDHYECKESGSEGKVWQIREMIEVSDAITIPNISMELMNQKRMQVELSKKQVYQKYLTEEECKILQGTLVFTTDFESYKAEEIPALLKFIEEKGVDNFILKPNLEGGGNNIYGLEAYQTIRRMGVEELKRYILMEKIHTTALPNVTFLGSQSYQGMFINEISKYGFVCEIDGKLIKNSSKGHLIRMKPSHENEGGVMTGIGSISNISFKK